MQPQTTEDRLRNLWAHFFRTLGVDHGPEYDDAKAEILDALLERINDLDPK